ncbi:MAG: TetR-like C-terminal domain-containing protein, partial [Oscillospiraceae bacterium]
QGQNSFTEFFGEFLQPIAFNYLKQSFAENESNEFYADFFTDAFRVAIIRWLKEDSDMSPAQIVGLFKFAAVGASSSIIKKEPSPNT